MKKWILFFSFLFTINVQAQDAFYVSGMLGLTNVDSGDSSVEYNTELSYGVRGGLLFNDHVSAGVYVNRYGGTGSVNGINSDLDVTLTNLMAEVTYFFTPADENSFWVSGLLGTTRAELDCPTGFSCENSSDTSYGVSAGYQFAVAPNFTIGPQFTYIRVDSDGDGVNMISGSANLTFWL